MRKRIAILGSTGSIGKQALEVIRAYPGHFEATVLTAMTSSADLIDQAREFQPRAVVIGQQGSYREVKEALKGSRTEVFGGVTEFSSIVQADWADVVLNAIVGYAGFEPTLCALRTGKQVALANKESLVVGGALVTEVARENGVPILPVDSEHSAVFQCLVGENPASVSKIILTASGGPFLGFSKGQLEKVTISDALNHPNWNMGNKITIDSATLMNKGLELIEARWLFNCRPDQLEAVIHPQSIVHSLVAFNDGSVKAQLSLPDMKLPIAYALNYPERLEDAIAGIRWADMHDLTFRAPDMENFRNLALALEALEQGGNAPCILNAANEVAVDAFLKGRITFVDLPEVVERSLDKVSHIQEPAFPDYVETDRETRRIAEQIVDDLS